MENMNNMLYYDWNNLIVLDACRFDIFEQVNDIPGELKMIRSVGCQTIEWVRGTFGKRKHDDTVYYSSNPFISESELGKLLPGLKFHRIYNVWKSGYDKAIKNVPPRNVNKIVYETYEMHKEKRKVIHYNNPHIPFLTGDEKVLGKNYSEMKKDLEAGLITASDIRLAYIETTREVLSAVKELLAVLKGKTIITADHGDMLGEKGLWGHGTRHRGILEQVPLLVVKPDEELIIEQLDSLGYMDKPQTYIYAWGNNEKRKSMKGRECEVLARGKKNTCTVKFLDNGQVESISRNALRKVK